MSINFRKYFEEVVRLMRENNIWVDTPEKPFDFVLDANGNILEVVVRKKVMKTKENYQLKYSEYGELQGEVYQINKHSYHFEGKTSNTKILNSFRVDLDSNGDLHANPDSTYKNLPHRMLYPEDINFDIREYSLPIAIGVSVEYIRTEKYPLLKEHGEFYNSIKEDIRSVTV